MVIIKTFFTYFSRKSASFVLMLLALLTVSSCGTGKVDLTPIVVFPSIIPGGTRLPTFAVGPTAVPPTFPPPTAVVPTQVAAQPTPSIPTRIPTLVPPTAIPTLDNNWTPLANGVEWRRLNFVAISTGQLVGVLIVRITPQSVKFKVRYVPGQVKSIQQWQLALPGAVAIINANYFDKSNNPIGLVGTDSVLYGSSVPRSDAGMFQVVNDNARVRSLWLEKFQNTERFDQAIQGFPMLVARGQTPTAFNSDLSILPDQRTVIAQDMNGHILLIITPFSVVTFMDLAKWLGVSGLQIDMALNMDGGTSTELYIATGGPSQFTGFKPIPIVLAVYPR